MKIKLFGASVMLMVSGVLFSVPTPAKASPLSVEQLRCEQQDEPAGIQSAHPQLSWQLQSATRGEKQSAYQIIAASSPDKLAEGKADLWDSGKVLSGQSIHVAYSGEPLASGKPCFWKVRIWGKDGAASAWSEPGRWSMGMMAAADWKAQWIGARAEKAVSDMGMGFRSQPEKKPDAEKWIKIDLGKVEAIDRVVLFPIKYFHDTGTYMTGNHGLPIRFHIEVADNAHMMDAMRIVDHTQVDYEPANGVQNRCLFRLPAGISGRYLRITATKLRAGENGDYWFGLSEVHAFSPSGRNLAEGSRVDASDSLETKEWSAANLTKYFKTDGSEAVLLRKEIELAAKPVRALAHMSGLGIGELYLNGRKVSDHELDPADTDYRKRVMYVSHDVTDAFQKGKNAIGVMLGNGWYDINFRDVWDFEGSTWAGPKKLLLQIELEFADGSTRTIVSDPSWKWSTGEIAYNSIRGGETIDMRRKVQPEWKQPGFDDRSWKPVVQLPAPSGPLESQQHAPVRATKEVRPVGISEPAPGIYVYDMGQNFSGWVKFRAAGKKGQRVWLNFAEQLNHKGTINQLHWSSSYIFSQYQGGELVLAGEGVETFEPRFTYYGFQYVQVEGLPAKPSLDDLTGVMLHTDPKPAGDFACSNEKFNRLHSVITHSLLNYIHHRPRDPARERVGWTQDSWQIAEPSYYNYDLGSIYRFWFEDMKDGQEASGHVLPVNPSPAWGRRGQPGGSLSCPWWGGALHYGPWQLYLFTGNEALLKEFYPGMKASVDFIHSTSDELIINWGLGDWGEVGTIDKPVRTPQNLSNTCAFFYLSKITAQVADILGEKDEARKYHQLANDIRDAFNKKFLDVETGRYGKDSQTVYALPLLLGMVQENFKDRAVQHLADEVRKSNGHLSTGFVGTTALMKVLAEMGHPELAYTIANQEDVPSWWGMIKDGRTTMPEFWDGQGVQNIVSLSGACENWFYYGLAGIRPDPAKPGFKHTIIRPAFAKDLTWLKAHHDSPYGRIAVAWERGQGGQFTFNLTLPANTTATVYIPCDKVQEGDQNAANSMGVALVGTENGTSVFEVQSGSYRFTWAARDTGL